jgi:hypothetical protein
MGIVQTKPFVDSIDRRCHEGSGAVVPIAAQGFLCGGAPSVCASMVNGILASALLGTISRNLLMRPEHYPKGLHLNKPFIITLRNYKIMKEICCFDSEFNTQQ